ncbi:MAG: DNA mismatch repair protein MutS, partial [Nitrospirae bacterium]|nr:DNA mismatch repair protein MutS [Nitrospirota bacterium]
MSVTPLLAQYKEIKERHKDSILFFRMGDFYEMFYDDAITASRILEITLTARNKEKGEDVPMCGVPYHAANAYIAKLIKKGFKVAICEQLEDPKSAKGIVKRDVVRIITPGTAIDPLLLDSKENNFIAALYPVFKKSSEAKDIERAGLAILDISTGDFFVSEFADEYKTKNLIDELSRFMPKEALLPKDSEKHPELLKLAENNHILVNHYDAWQFSTDSAYKTLTGHFKTKSLEGFGCKKEDLSVNAAGAIISYIKETQKSDLTNITSMKIYNPSDYMLMDSATIRNLELIEDIRNRERKGSLLSTIDRTETAMGARLLKQRLLQPLSSVKDIQKRLDAVGLFKEDITIRNKIVSCLKEISDIERITGRITLGTANARDLIGLKNSIQKLPKIKDCISDIN